MTNVLQALQRAKTWVNIPYSQVGVYNGYRRDCSGYVSMCWGIAPPGLSTVTLVTQQQMYSIDWDKVIAGDAIGVCGPGTEGDAGHIQLVSLVDRQRGFIWVYEQTPPSGARFNKYTIQERKNSGYIPYRYISMEGSHMGNYGPLPKPTA